MLEKKDIEYFNNGFSENEKFWRRLREKPNFKNKSILDFGCGHGALCLDIARSYPRRVLGIDLEENLLNFANENLIKNYSKYSNIVSFKKIDLISENINEKFDYIVSKDTFEHSLELPKVLDKMFDLLNNGGKAYIGFGPLYNFYNGDHARTRLYLPWLHLAFSEKFIINRLNKVNKIQIKSIQDLGLSKYSLKEYEKFFKESKFKINFYINNQSDHPISFIFNFLSKINFLKEYFTYNIYCILEK
tara:strand:+ start:94 stop:831 length:738 start_codon:yes stop_codon:yes gene_type:complete